MRWDRCAYVNQRPGRVLVALFAVMTNNLLNLSRGNDWGEGRGPTSFKSYDRRMPDSNGSFRECSPITVGSILSIFDISAQKMSHCDSTPVALFGARLRVIPAVSMSLNTLEAQASIKDWEWLAWRGCGSRMALATLSQYQSSRSAHLTTPDSIRLPQRTRFAIMSGCSTGAMDVKPSSISNFLSPAFGPGTRATGTP